MWVQEPCFSSAGGAGAAPPQQSGIAARGSSHLRQSFFRSQKRPHAQSTSVTVWAVAVDTAKSRRTAFMP